jgi:Flp pilus assembly pilin Flp
MKNEPGVEPEAYQSRRLNPYGEETIMDLIVKFYGDESGAPAVEYALLLAFITLAVAASVKNLGNPLTGLFKLANDKWPQPQ